MSGYSDEQVAELRDENARLRAELDALRERLAALHADGTGHLHVCARVNGAWVCAPGCAVGERDVLAKQLKDLISLAIIMQRPLNLCCFICGEKILRDQAKR